LKFAKSFKRFVPSGCFVNNVTNQIAAAKIISEKWNSTCAKENAEKKKFK
jgi:hypothetical protein